MINADNKIRLIKNSRDGKRYAIYPDGDFVRISYAFGLASDMSIGSVTLINNNVITTSLLLSGWNQEITADQTLTGVAPLVVHFDGVGTDHSNPSIDGFLDLFYHWDFGYTSTASQSVWGTTALPKGQQIGGPIAAHCFEKAGTYPCSVRVQDAFGAYVDRYFTVIVRSADDYYSAGNTICISKAGDFTGAPSGATTTTTPPTTVTSNTRYLYRAGEDYSTSTLSIAHSKSKVIVGSFGIGSKPKVWKKLVQTPPKTTNTILNSVTFMDLNVDQMDVPFANYVSYIRCEVFNQPNIDQVANSGLSVQYYYVPANLPSNTNPADITWPKNPSFIENNLDRSNSLDAYGFYGNVNRGIFLGNTIQGEATIHSIRLPVAYKTVLSHNSFSKIGINRQHYIKLHSRGTDSFTEDLAISFRPMSKYVVISDNINAAGPSDYYYTAAPQDSSSTEFISYVLMERNVFDYGSADKSYQTFHSFGGTYLSLRSYSLSGTTTSRRLVGFDLHSSQLSADKKSPYFVPAGNPSIDGSRIFTATGAVTPSKAGT